MPALSSFFMLEETIYAACSAISGVTCYPVAQTQDATSRTFPAIVYTCVANRSAGLFAGTDDTTREYQFDCQASSYSESVRVERELIEALDATGRIISVGLLLDDFDSVNSIYRRIRRVSFRNG